jgi:hypothetical protein
MIATGNIYAVHYGDGDGAYVKMKPMDHKGRRTWRVTPVHSYAQATKWASPQQAQRTIQEYLSFEGSFAIVVTE